MLELQQLHVSKEMEMNKEETYNDEEIDGEKGRKQNFSIYKLAFIL